VLLTKQFTVCWICGVGLGGILDQISILTPKDLDGNGNTIGVIAKCCGIIVDMFDRTTIPGPVAANMGCTSHSGGRPLLVSEVEPLSPLTAGALTASKHHASQRLRRPPTVTAGSLPLRPLSCALSQDGTRPSGSSVATAGYNPEHLPPKATARLRRRLAQQ